MKCFKDQCRSPVACGGFGYCRELNFKEFKTRDDLRSALFDAIGAKSLAMGLNLTETQVLALADAASLSHMDAMREGSQ